MMVPKNMHAVGKQGSRNCLSLLGKKLLAVPFKFNCGSVGDRKYGVFVDPVVSHFYLYKDGMNLPNEGILSNKHQVVH